MTATVVIDPLDAATNVNPSLPISATFTPGTGESMDPTSIASTIYDNRIDPATGSPCAFSPYYVFDTFGTGALTADAVAMGWTVVLSDPSPGVDEPFTVSLSTTLLPSADYGVPGISPIFAIAGWACSDTSGSRAVSTAQNFATGLAPLVSYGRPGEDYSDPLGIPPAWYHPQSPLAAPVLAETLRMAYAVADRHARTLTRSSAPPAMIGVAPDVLDSAIWATFPFGRGRPYVPLGVTHIVGVIDAESFVAEAGTIDFRVVAGADVGLTMGLEPSTAPPAPLSPDGRAPNVGVFAHVGNRMRARVEVQLASELGGSRIQITPQFRTGATGNSIRALGAHFWWEVRRV